MADELADARGGSQLGHLLAQQPKGGGLRHDQRGHTNDQGAPQQRGGGEAPIWSRPPWMEKVPQPPRGVEKAGWWWWGRGWRDAAGRARAGPRAARRWARRAWAPAPGGAAGRGCAPRARAG